MKNFMDVPYCYFCTLSCVFARRLRISCDLELQREHGEVPGTLKAISFIGITNVLQL